MRDTFPDRGGLTCSSHSSDSNAPRRNYSDNRVYIHLIKSETVQWHSQVTLPQ
jgi:hypothetical protein